MSSIDKIVNIVLNFTSQVLTADSLDTMLFIGNTKEAEEDAGQQDIYRVKTYDNLTAVAVDYPAGTVEYKAATAYFGQGTLPRNISIGQKYVAETFVEAYTAIKAKTNEFYGVTIYDKSNVNGLKNLADVIETEFKIFMTTDISEDSITLGDTSSIGYLVKENAYKRTFVFGDQNSAATDYPECGILGYALAQTVGSYTMDFKTIAGVTGSYITDAIDTIYTSKNMGFYVKYGANISSISATKNIKAGNGRFFDFVIAQDWLHTNLQISIFNAFISNARIYFDSRGLSIIKDKIENVCLNAVNNNILASYDLSFPKYSDITTEEQGTRILQNVTLSVELLNSIHGVDPFTITFTN